jgi:hypothetical protein
MIGLEFPVPRRTNAVRPRRADNPLPTKSRTRARECDLTSSDPSGSPLLRSPAGWLQFSRIALWSFPGPVSDSHLARNSQPFVAEDGASRHSVSVVHWAGTAPARSTEFSKMTTS